MKVRRDSDNTEQDIGFVKGILDTVSLLSFVGNGNGFVRKWYDQSGNGNDCGQTNATYQPKIVNSGSVYTLNSRPAFLQNISSYDYNYAMILTTAVNAANDHSLFVVGKREAKNRNFYLINGSFPAYMQYSDGKFYAQVPSGSNYIKFNYFADTTIVQTIWEAYQQSQVQKIYKNNVEKTLTIGSQVTGSQTFTEVCYCSYGYYQEIIFYQSDEYTDRASMVANINAFYSVY